MGRKARPKAIDVTKSTLLQATATTLLVDLGDGVRSVQVTEEDISPTQGSEHAFSMRRKGVISESNKVRLCQDWQYGSCLERAACLHIHIRSLANVGDHLLSTLQHNGTPIVNTTVSSTPTPPPPAPRASSGVSPWTSGPATASEIIKNSTPAPPGTTWLEKLVPHKHQQSQSQSVGREDAASRLAGSLPATASWGKASSNNNSIALKGTTAGSTNGATEATAKTDASSKTLSNNNSNNNNNNNNNATTVGGGNNNNNTNNTKASNTNGSAGAVSANSTSSAYSSTAAAAMKAAVPGMRAAAAAAAAAGNGHSNNGNTQPTSVSAGAASNGKMSNNVLKSPPQYSSTTQASNGHRKTIENEPNSTQPSIHTAISTEPSYLNEEHIAKEEPSGMVDSWEDLLLKQDRPSNHPQQAFKSTKGALPLYQVGSPVSPIDALLAGGAGAGVGVDSLAPPPSSATATAVGPTGLPDKQQLLMCLVGDEEESGGDDLAGGGAGADPLSSMFPKPRHPMDPMAGMPSNLYGGVGPSLHGANNSAPPSFASNGNPGSQSLNTDPYNSVGFSFGSTAADHGGYFGGAGAGLYGSAGAVNVPKFSTGVLPSVMPSAAALGGGLPPDSSYAFMPAHHHGVDLYTAPLGLRPLSPSMQDLFSRLTADED